MVSQFSKFNWAEMLEVVISVLLILVAYCVNTCWIRPRGINKRYAKAIRDRGYTVLEVPFNPFSIELIKTIKRGLAQGDAMKVYKDQRSKYDVVVTNILSKPRLQINHPDFLKEYYAVDKHYEYPKAIRATQLFARVAGYGLAFSEGQVWHRKRKIFNKVFNFDFIQSQSFKIAQICSDSMRQMEQKKNSNKAISSNDVIYSISELTVKIFSTVMLTIFLGGSSKETINGQPAGQFMKKLMEDVTNQLLVPVNNILGPKFLNWGLTKNHKDVNNRIKIVREWGYDFIRKRVNQIKQQMAKRTKKEKPDDIIEAIMMAQHLKNSKNKQDQVSEQQILEEFMIFFLAGTDTTSTFTQNMIYQTAKNPEIEKKVREEIDKYMQQEDYSYENLKKFKYIEMVQKQNSRFSGPGTQLFGRYAIKDNFLNGIPIKKDTLLGIITIANHFSEKYFTNPNQFRPERWQSQCNNLPNFVYGGFSAGARTCIGKHLALMESKIALIKFMKRYKNISLGNSNYKMVFKFAYSPEDFETKLTINHDSKI